MSKRKPREPKVPTRTGYLDVDGGTMAIGRLADLDPAAFEDVIELAYAYLWILDPNKLDLARYGLLSERAALRAVRMLTEKAEREARDEEKKEAVH